MMRAVLLALAFALAACGHAPSAPPVCDLRDTTVVNPRSGYWTVTVCGRTCTMDGMSPTWTEGQAKTTCALLAQLP